MGALLLGMGASALCGSWFRVAEKPAVFELGQAVSGKSFPAWAVAKDNKELLAFLNEFIAKEKANGRFAELQKKWFGEAFPDLPVAFEPEF